MDCDKCQIEDEYIEEGWLRKAVVKFCPLHAAAPELLEALKVVRTALGIREDFAPLGIAISLAPMIQQAIAKAEGK